MNVTHPPAAPGVPRRRRLHRPAAAWPTRSPSPASARSPSATRPTGRSIEVDGTVVGSALIGQAFTSPQYFHPRPSAAGDGYDGAASSGSNLGPTNPDYLATVAERGRRLPRRERARRRRPRARSTPSPPRARASTRRSRCATPACRRRGSPRSGASTLDVVLAAIDDHTSGRPLGVLGDPGVNVLELNLALDQAAG